MLIKNNNVDYTLSMNIVEDATTFFLTCKGEGLSAVAKGKAPTKVEGNQFHILDYVQSDNPLCRLNVFPMTLNYEVHDTQLSLKDSLGQVMILNRVQ